ncbi:outer membrane beta-barrel protein [Mongoliibacter ruber]|uniref:Outer membrane protein with beta-barrel domain n=1 Tax=Mongoliibacter ruber TaxID=1750599 RepID=A0A2T0WLC6_9BACT|nr:outer membrane beta-barrel protein [Mongoliibacter ruber]PRY87462.1 outer membrane protein with beta-barrel domain [Mongoliibacter ruber]
MDNLKVILILGIFFLVLFVTETKAQKNHWGGNVEFGYFSLEGREYIGGPGFYPREYFAIGVTYIRTISPKFDVETGLTYSRSRFLIRAGGNPNFPDIVEYNDWENLITAPFYLKWNVSPRVFFNGGPNISWNMEENTFDTGYGFGIGYQVSINDSNKILINPMFQARGLSSDQNSGVYHIGLRLVFTTSSFFGKKE